MSVKDRIDQATADLQAQVGRFLELRSRIMRLPSSDPRRAPLLDTQVALESKAMKTVSALMGLKDKVVALKGLQAVSYFTNSANLSNLTSLLKDSADLVKAIARQTAAVNAATSSAPAAHSSPAAAPSTLSMNPLLKEALILGAAVGAYHWIWGKARRSVA
ncbi:MAG: hypothetical protein KGI98_15950 [Euryarchaeota archaeon]|nr:hypothetical protein [Euryarchaeota archaeon]